MTDFFNVVIDHFIIKFLADKCTPPQTKRNGIVRYCVNNMYYGSLSFKRDTNTIKEIAEDGSQWWTHLYKDRYFFDTVILKQWDGHFYPYFKYNNAIGDNNIKRFETSSKRALIKSDSNDLNAFSKHLEKMEDDIFFYDSEYTLSITEYCYFHPIDDEEKNRFLKAAKNFEQIETLEEEFSCLGIFAFKRKKEILETIKNIYYYAYLVVGKACIDRVGKNYYQEALNENDAAFQKKEKEVEQATTALQKVDFTAFKKRQELKFQLKLCNESLNSLKDFKESAPKQISKIALVFEELDRKLAEFDNM